MADTKIAEINNSKINEKLRRRWQFYVKILELVICFLCIGFVLEPAKRGDLAKLHLNHFVIILTTFLSYFLVNFIFLISQLIGDKIPHGTGFIFSIAGSCLFLVSGVLLAVDRKNRYFLENFHYEPRPYILKHLAISTGLSFLNTILFGVEAVFIWKFKEDF